jgi:CheY-like chemotaxis protein
LVIQQAQNTLEKTKAYELKLQIHAQNQPEKAVIVGLEVLQMLGISMEENWAIKLPELSELKDFPQMTDPYQLAAMNILVLIAPPVVYTKPQLFASVALTMTNLCINHGHSAPAIYAYSLYGWLINIGTQFWFELALPVIDYDIAQISIQQLIIGIKDKSPKVLVVDDNLENQAVVVDLLAPLGFLVASSNDGHEGLEKAISWLPDAIITDLIMPKMDGFELIRQLRQSPVLKEKVIIASSASVYNADKTRSLAIGSNAFLPKPIQVEILLEQLQHHLNLTWVYGNKLPETTEESSIAPMIFPPINELKKLYELTLMADIDELEEHVTILAKDEKLKPFVTKMQAFLKKYQVGQLKKWLEEVMTSDK